MVCRFSRFDDAELLQKPKHGIPRSEKDTSAVKKSDSKIKTSFFLTDKSSAFIMVLVPISSSRSPDILNSVLLFFEIISSSSDL